MKSLTNYLDLGILALVVGVGILIVSTGLGTGRADRDRLIEEAAAADQIVDAALEGDRYDEQPGARILEKLSPLPETVRSQWAPRPVQRQAQTGLFYHQASLEDLRSERDLELRFFPPTNVSATADIGLIRISWSRDERTTVDVAEYIVYRGSSDSAPERLAEVDTYATSYEDSAVMPGVLYTYQVTARTDEAIMLRRDRAESRPSRAVSIRGKKDYEIVPVSLDPAAGSARVLVRKFIDGVWHEKEFTVQKGDRIGGVDPGTGVSYDTNCTAVELAQRVELVTETRDEVQFGPDGLVVLVDSKPIRRKVTYDRERPVVTLSFRNEVEELEKLELRP